MDFGAQWQRGCQHRGCQDAGQTRAQQGGPALTSSAPWDVRQRAQEEQGRRLADAGLNRTPSGSSPISKQKQEGEETGSHMQREKPGGKTHRETR